MQKIVINKQGKVLNQNEVALPKLWKKIFMQEVNAEKKKSKPNMKSAVKRAGEIYRKEKAIYLKKLKS
jgi:hypothetical protein